MTTGPTSVSRRRLERATGKTDNGRLVLYQLTLVRNPNDPPFPDETITQVLEIALDVGFRAEPWRWLSEGYAGTVALDGDSLGRLRERLRAWDGLQADIFLVPGSPKAKKLLVADMESTTIENEFLEDLAAFAGAQEKVKRITARAMNGEIDFADALTERVALLKGLPTHRLAEVLGSVRVSGGARELVATMKSGGAQTALVSGGFACFAQPVMASLGFDHQFSNQLETRAGHLTGRLAGPIVDAGAKARFLHQLCDRMGITPDEAVAVGDGANDLAMIKAAGLGVGYRPKPAVAEACDLRVERADLTALLYLQGYHRYQFNHDSGEV